MVKLFVLKSLALGTCIGLAAGSYHFPKAVYAIGGPAVEPTDGSIIDLPWDTVLVTRYIHTAEVSVTSSHVYKARIDCFDVFIQPATQFQSCWQSKDRK